MSVSSISFWQQDRNYWVQSQARSKSLAAMNSLISAMASVQTNLNYGLSSIANQQALSRVNKQIADQQSALAKALSGGSNSSSSTPSGPAPATATGTVPLTTSTPLSTLGIPPNGTITVGDGTNTTIYNSTGTDTVANLIGAINANVAGNAYVTASLNGHGKLIITGKNLKEPVLIGGTFASDIGFGPGNQTFKPTAGSSSSSSSATSSSSTTAASTAAASTAASSGLTNLFNDSPAAATQSTTGVQSLASQTISSAASLLNQFGVAGSLVDMLT